MTVNRTSAGQLVIVLLHVPPDREHPTVGTKQPLIKMLTTE
jgi:hypothetical protein